MVRTWYFLILLALLAVYCCKPDRSSYNKSAKYEDDTSSYAQLESEIKKVYYRFPSPDEMFIIIDSIGLQFDNTLLLPAQYAKKYLDSKNHQNQGVSGEFDRNCSSIYKDDEVIQGGRA